MCSTQHGEWEMGGIWMGGKGLISNICQHRCVGVNRFSTFTLERRPCWFWFDVFLEESEHSCLSFCENVRYKI